MKKLIYISLIFIFFFTSCRSLKNTNYQKTYKISKRKLLKELKKNSFFATSFSSRFSFDFKDNSQDISASGKIKIKKDSIIWCSIRMMGIPLMKLYITPGKIQYYNKLTNEYYNGDFALINQELGTEINFNNLQNLLIGDILYYSVQNYGLATNEKYYNLQSGTDTGLTQIKLTSFFKVFSEKIINSKKEELEIQYSNYKNINHQNLPEKIHLSTKNTNNDIQLDIEYKNINLNKNQTYPFSLPSGYTRIVL